MKKTLFLITIIFCLFFWGLSSSYASVYQGAWEPTDTLHTNFAEFEFWFDNTYTSTKNLFLHPYNDQTNALQIWTINDSASGSVYFKKNKSGTWKAASVSWDKNPSDFITLGSKPWFDIYAEDTSNNKDTTYSYNEVEENIQYGLNFNEGSSNNEFDLLITMNDAAPVPIPAAAWLLGFGLLGLVGFRKKSRQA